MKDKANITTTVALSVASFIAGIFFAGSWLLDSQPTINPVEIWCDGAYDFTYREVDPAAKSAFMFSCMEDMADGKSDIVPTFNIEGGGPPAVDS